MSETKVKIKDGFLVQIRYEHGGSRIYIQKENDRQLLADTFDAEMSDILYETIRNKLVNTHPSTQKEGSEPEINTWYAIRKFDSQGREELVVRQFLGNVGWWYSKDITVDWIVKLDFSRQSPSPDAGREWISVKDRLPKENIPVYVYTNSTKLSTGLVRKGVWYYADETEDLTNAEEYNTAWSFHLPARWMPLPQPPKE